jgi:hypothetical protein
MNVKLAPEQEQIIRDELKTGRFRTGEEVVAVALETLRTKDHLAGVADGDRRDAVRDVLAFVEKNRTRLDGISVKELTHEGHRP